MLLNKIDYTQVIIFVMNFFNIPNAIILSILLTLLSCKDNKNDDKLKITCTTDIIKDLLSNIIRNKKDVSLSSLMGSGVDPHLYKATQKDIKKIYESNVIIYNGLNLEGKLSHILDNLKTEKKIIAVSNGLEKSDLIIDKHYNAIDPHIWHNPKNWIKVCKYVTNQIIKIDSSNSDFYLKNMNIYISKLDSTYNILEENISKLDIKKRILITSHDAFSYYGRVFNFKIKSLQGISTLSEYGIKDIINVINFIEKNNVSAIFVENSVSEKSIKSVIEGCKSRNINIKIGGKLYSDSLGEINSPTETYIGMIKYNTNTIVNNLK